MTTALYPGSFDPVTNGHLDIIVRASQIFDRLIIGVLEAPRKNLLFTSEERRRLMVESVEELPNAEVMTYSGLTVDFAHRVGASVMVRGLRKGSDFEFEFEMALMNRKMAPDIDIICLMTGNEYQFLSSSLLKEAAQLGGDVSGLLPEHVFKALQQKFQSEI